MANNSSPGARSSVSSSLAPKSENQNLRKSIPGFSPVSVSDSPVNKSPKAGNLTGNPRRVRDNAAELFNLIQDWNAHQLNGVTYLTEIANLKFSWSEDVSNKDYPPGIIPLIENLNDICEKMNVIVEKMIVVCKEFHSISKLENFRTTNPAPMFLTWPSEKFGETADIIATSYSKQLKLNVYIKENIAHCFNKSNAILYSSGWLYQPYIEDFINLLLESMLKETGHR